MDNLRLANLFAALADEVVRRIELAEPRHANATDSASAALNLIGLSDGCSNGALARALKLSHAATARLVERLVAGALVETRRGEDRRSVLLTLTAAGRARARDIVGQRVLVVADLIGTLDERQRAALTDIAETLLPTFAATFDDAIHICRLCDEQACPQDRCPVHALAEAHMAAAAR